MEGTHAENLLTISLVLQTLQCWTTDRTGTRCTNAAGPVPARLLHPAGPSRPTVVVVAAAAARRAAAAAAGSRRRTAVSETAAPAGTRRTTRTASAVCKAAVDVISAPRVSDNVLHLSTVEQLLLLRTNPRQLPP